ncbi:MAG: ABC transporter ATP-binding protein [Desulfohalobiaceae bacterium]|nr:ABC transporter ATP-binding protein [Desulfohalobiaceae bacterium]
MSLLEVDDLRLYFYTKRGTAKAVDRVGFRVEKNETLGLIGESGCGKTTTALAIMKLIKPPGQIVHGKILFQDRDIVSLDKEDMRELRGKGLAIIRQEAQNSLNPVMSIGKQIAEGLLVHDKIGKKEAWERAEHQLGLVGLDTKMISHFPHEFSGGMKQRAVIAMATVCRPQFLILDEPTTGLDVIVQRQLLSLINHLKQELGLTALLIAHDLAVIAETCDRVAVMYAGKIVEHSDTVSLYRKPLHPYSQALLSAYPNLKGEKKQLRSIPGVPPRLINTPYGCKFEPRCSYALEACKHQEPEMMYQDGRYVACHLFQA